MGRVRPSMAMPPAGLGLGLVRVRVRVSKLDEIEEENYVTQRDVIRELSS